MKPFPKPRGKRAVSVGRRPWLFVWLIGVAVDGVDAAATASNSVQTIPRLMMHIYTLL